MPKQTGKVLKSGAMARAFQQLSTQSQTLTQAWQNIWERPDMALTLWTLGEHAPYWTHQDNYLQTPDTLVLLSDQTARQLLGLILGSSQNPRLSSLEHALLHRACQQLSRQANLPLGQAHLTLPAWTTYWQLTSREGYLGQVCILWPKALVKTLPYPPELADKALPWFKGVGVKVRVTAGCTHLPFESLPLLEPGDVLVLDRSQSNQLVIETPEGPLRFNTTMSDHLPQYPAMASDGPNWNHLMVELTAEFDPFLLPLGEVRAISEGLLIELDDLAHNTLHIHSQGTRIAQGKLVVVGDKFAVRIERVLGEPIPETNPPEQPEVDDKLVEDDPNPINEETNTTDEEESLDQAFDEDEEQEQW